MIVIEFVSKKILYLVFIAMLSGCSGGDFGEGKHIIEGKVISIGTCGGGNGFFSGNYECAVTTLVDGRIEYWNVYGPVVDGQSIYKHCWVEEGAAHCFSTASKNIRPSYMAKES